MVLSKIASQTDASVHSTFTSPYARTSPSRSLKKNYDELKAICEQQESRVHQYESKLQTWPTGYLMLERFFFFGLSQIPSLKCNHWWVILVFTLLSTLLYFLLFLDVVIELYKIQYSHDMICKKLAEISQHFLEAKDRDGVDLFSLDDEGEFSDDGFELRFHEKMLMFEEFKIGWRKVFIYFSACVLLAVTAIDLYACNYLLCS